MTVLEYIYLSVVKPICGSATAKASNFPCLERNCRASHSTDVRERYECFDVRAWAQGVIFGCCRSGALGSSRLVAPQPAAGGAAAPASILLLLMSENRAIF